ncbi:MAG: hypothetical protein M1813_002386 [Trichoglossum hirsutum]|nr:MAG: hypothetical protein M1813_002386 [Trichoglossum hirsutum]
MASSVSPSQHEASHHPDSAKDDAAPADAGNTTKPKSPGSKSLVGRGQSAPMTKFWPFGNPTPAAAAAEKGVYWYCILQCHETNYGCEATFSCFRPRVENKDHSLLQCSISSTNSGVLQTIEAGWRRYAQPQPGGNPAPEAQFFVFFTTDAYKGEDKDYVQGYNQNVKGWVQFPGVTPRPGQGFPYSHIDGVQQELSLKWALVVDNWYLQVNDIWIGYYPATLFSNAKPTAATTLRNFGMHVTFQGEVYDSNEPKPSNTTTDMGSGLFPEEGFGRAAYIKKMKYQPNPWFTDTTSIDIVKSATLISDKTRYNMTDEVTGDVDWGYRMFLGGPGAPSHDWLDWDTIGGNSQPGTGFLSGYPVTAISRTAGYIDLFVCAKDGKIYTSWSTARASFSGFDDSWSNLGGNDFPPGSQVAAVAQSQDNLDLFVVGKDGNVYTSNWTSTSGWSGTGTGGWQNIGGNLPLPTPGERPAEVVAVSRYAGAIDVFACDKDGRAVTCFQNEVFKFPAPNAPWVNLSAAHPAPFTPGSKVAAVKRTKDNLDIFITGTDGVVYTAYWSTGNVWSSLVGGGKPWVPLGGGTGSVSFAAGAPIAAVTRSKDNLDLFLIASDSRVYTTWWTAGPGGGWETPENPWKNIGGGDFEEAYHVAALSRTPDTLDVFICGTTGKVFTSWWAFGKEWSGIHDNWTSLQGGFRASAEIGVVARSQLDLDIFVVDNDGKVEQTQWAG